MVKVLFSFIIGLLFFMSCPLALCATGHHKVRMGVLLPLKEKTARGAKMVEFYRGMLMAVDSLKREGISIDVQAIHSGSSASEMDLLLASQSVNECDVIFGPLDAAQLPALADYCDIHQIHLVVPFSSLNTQLAGHPRHYLVNSPRYEVEEGALWYIQDQFRDFNLVLVETNEGNKEGMAFGEHLRSSASQWGAQVNILNIDGDENAFSNALSQQQKNLIILNSPSIKAVNLLTSKLRDFRQKHPEYEMALFGYPSWQTYTQQLLSVFYEMDTYVYTTFFRNPISQRCENFDKQFTQWFHSPMNATFPRYGLMGFDIAYYFLRGLSIYGSDRLQSCLDQIPSRPFQHPLYFQSSQEGDGYVNTFVELIHYTTNQTIEIITRNR